MNLSALNGEYAKNKDEHWRVGSFVKRQKNFSVNNSRIQHDQLSDLMKQV